MFEYFGGVTRILVPDNCSTAVVHNNDWYTQQINAVYHEMAEHYGTVTEYLYNIPAQIGTDKCFLRCGRIFGTADGKGRLSDTTYQIYGVWLGYDENTKMANRSVKSLSQVAGQDFRLLYPMEPIRLRVPVQRVDDHLSRTARRGDHASRGDVLS